jgi:1-hydroxycarotenoid 3,4-desaturase
VKKVAVIGGGFGGMTAAAELAHKGHRVVLFEHGPTLGGKAQQVMSDGVALDTGPTLLTMPDVIRATFERLGASDLLPRFLPLPHQSRYYFSDGSNFDCHESLEQTKASVAAIDAGDAKSLAGFYGEAAQVYAAAGEPYLTAPFEGVASYMARVAKNGWAGLWRGATFSTLHGLAQKHFRNPKLHQFVGRFATYAGASPFEASAAYAMIAHLERAYGVFHVEGGMRALAVALEACLRRTGVEIRLNTAAHVHRNRSETMVTAIDQSEVFDSVVINADPLASATPKASGLAMSGYVLLLKVSQRLKLPHHTVIFSEHYAQEFKEIFAGRTPQHPTVYFCHPAATDGSVATANASGVFCMVNSPVLADKSPEAAQRWREGATHLQAFCVSKLRQLCPSLLPSEIHVMGERTPVDFAGQGAPLGSIYGHLPHGTFGPFARPKMRSNMPGVYFSGGGTHPGGGVPLVMLSGHFAADLAQRHLVR